jgi:hypothetical protein
LVGTSAEAFFCNGSAPQRYDVILFSHSLENIVAPIPVLEGARRALGDYGVVLVYTPNLEYFDSMNPYHPYIYSPETLTRLVSRAGLGVERLEAKPSPATRAIALDVTGASDEIVCFARAAPAPVEMPAPRVDVQALADAHALGQKVAAWAELSTAELLRRAVLQAGRGVRRRIGRGR